jgi:hypothetical protein
LLTRSYESVLKLAVTIADPTMVVYISPIQLICHRYLLPMETITLYPLERIGTAVARI